MSDKQRILLPFLFFITFFTTLSQNNIRQNISLNKNWHTIANDTNIHAYDGFENSEYSVSTWEMVDVPHNWDQYEGYRRMLHGNRHGYAWYRKEFKVNNNKSNKRYFLFFEGVGSYATVWLNGKIVGYHAGGRTTFTLDITDAIFLNNVSNILAVRAGHPANIRDLPWVCGGCSEEWGFSEGSQPMGIFRPVHLIITGNVRVEPFGVHIWNDTSVNEKTAKININTEIKNYSDRSRIVTILQKLINTDKEISLESQQEIEIPAGKTVIIKQRDLEVFNPRLWYIEDPHLYVLETEIKEDGKTIDYTTTKYGIRWISWPVYRNNGDNRFFLNGKPVFINGTAEYEHMIGQSHAFSEMQIKSRVMQIKAAGFNAFRDAHQPHNLRYQHYWDSLGILFWTQMAAHIWLDNDDFKNNFKQLLRDWVKERRNSPSVILWGLENESTLPTWFAEECTQIIREMDPTSPSQRLVTTCNGGTGTDWNVIQNWSGTYAGDLYAYDKDISRELLNGEYGAWRSVDLHTEGAFQRNGVYSEDRMCQLIETKIRLAESVKDSCCGQFQWIFNSHDNPGRIQNGEGLREIDRIGPVNYKGLFTPWGEPLDVYYMYQSNYAPKETNPMIYIVSHTWPSRWKKPGIKDSIVVYSNCDEVDLFNGFFSNSLGKMKKGTIGTHFQWDNVKIEYNLLTAVGYVKNKPKVFDLVMLNHLPKSPDFNKLLEGAGNPTKSEEGYNYLYRVNCGGPDYIDVNGNLWMADRQKTSDTTWGSISWTDEFEGLPAYLASQRRIFDPIEGVHDWKLFQTFRYGRNKLRFEFPVPSGEYRIELFFIEPWYNRGNIPYGIRNMAKNSDWRVFDVAVNENILIPKLDISSIGHGCVKKIVLDVPVTNNKLTLWFPKIYAGQAIISAIAIATLKDNIKPVSSANSLITNLKVNDQKNEEIWAVKSWLDIGDKQYSNENITFFSLPSNLYSSEWICTPNILKVKDTLASFIVLKESDVFIALDEKINKVPSWMDGYVDQKTFIETDENGGKKFRVYGKRYAANSLIPLGKNGTANVKTSMYTVVVCLVTQLGYAADQRPRTRYQAENAKIKGDGLIIKEFKNSTFYEFSRSLGDTIEWEFSVGLGDTYSLRFRYLNNTKDSIPMYLKIIDMNGIIVRDDIIDFSPRKNQWHTLQTTTGTSINAGKYKVMLFPVNKPGLGINAMDVQ